MMDTAGLFHEQCVLVTGGTGSLGRRLVWEILRAGAHRVVVLSRDEKKQYDMRKAIPDERLRLVIGDVRDFARVAEVVRLTNPDIVIHAAALKHVVGCEQHPLEAVKTNVLGAENVVRAARGHGVTRLLVISTDKACLPLNVMGMTKALMERIALDAGYVAVRYGNVVGSRGSVVPFFRHLLEGGLTTLPLTHPSMTRFLMTVGDAVELVFEALAHGLAGELWVRRASCARVRDVGTAVARMLGKPDPEFRTIGFVHGEKFHETLVGAEERLRARELPVFTVVNPNAEGNLPPGDGEALRSDRGVMTIPQIVELLERAGREFAECPVADGWFTKG